MDHGKKKNAPLKKAGPLDNKCTRRSFLKGVSIAAAAGSAVGPVKEPEEVAEYVVDAVAEERFLILTDPIAQTWMERKTNDLERWLGGMRRLQAKMDGTPN